MPGKNAEIARTLERIADLMEIDGGESFRISSYRRAARTVADAAEDLADLARENRLTDLPGVGKGTADRIKQYLHTGHIDVLDELQKKFPAGVLDLLEIPNLGPKKVAAVHRQLKVSSLDDLKRAIDAGQVAELSGFGATSAKKIVEGIRFLESRGGRTPLGVALPVAEQFLEAVRSLKGVKRAEIAGSLRRGQETIGDVDIVCEAKDGAAVVKQFTSFEGVRQVLAAGNTKGSITVELSGGQELQIDLRVVEADAYGAALQYFTGSKEHNVRVREFAVKKKWRLNEYGLFDGEKRLAGKTEEGIYTKLGLPFVPPELREDRGETDPAFEPPILVTLDDIRGDLHMHTTASDGRASIEDMAEAAKQRGYDYIAICDHSKSATVANGLTVERMKRHIKAIRTANDKISGIEILVGCECDILADGTLDYPDDILADCDWVVASIHTAMGSGTARKHDPTQRTLAAIENRYVSAIGHPSGRLINRRAAMELDIDKIAQAAADTGTFLEVNASWQRLDLKDLHVRQALAGGVTLVIDTDAHSTDQLDQIRFGIITARRGGATKKDVLNTVTVSTLHKRIAAKR
jgi:DNA polymerase (family 10)